MEESRLRYRAKISASKLIFFCILSNVRTKRCREISPWKKYFIYLSLISHQVSSNKWGKFVTKLKGW